MDSDCLQHGQSYLEKRPKRLHRSEGSYPLGLGMGGGSSCNKKENGLRALSSKTERRREKEEEEGEDEFGGAPLAPPV